MQREARCRVIAALLLALGGCAHTDRFAIESAGQWPTGGKAVFSFGHLPVEDEPALRAEIADCLTSKGMTASVSPAYLVQLGLSDRPVGSDVLLVGNDISKRAHPPVKRRTQSFTVGLTDIATGREVYRVRVTAQYRRVTDRRPESALTRAACGAIGTEAATPPSP